MIDFSRVCRACSNQKTNLLNLFVSESEDDEPTLGEKFLICTSLELAANDELPQTICYSCAKALEDSFKFRIQCERSDRKLRSLVEEINVKTETESQQDDEYIIEYLEEDSEMDFMIEKIEHNEKDEKEDTESHSDRRSFICENCDKNFYTPRGLEMHTKIFHKRRKIMQNSTEQLLSRQKTATTNKKNFNNKFKESTLTKSPQEKRLQQRQKLETLSLSNTQTNYSMASSSSSLVIQQQQNFLYECLECCMCFKTTKDLQIHKAHKHKFACKQCGRLMRNKNRLEKHMELHMDGCERPFECTVCLKRFTLKRYLDRHMVYHQNMIFRCKEPNCNRVYNVKHKLVDHLRRLHNKQLTTNEVRLIMSEKMNEL